MFFAHAGVEKHCGICKELILIPEFVGMSLMYILNSNGDRQESFEIPALIFRGG